MVGIGNFFFKYRNFLFIILYLALFIPSPQLFTEQVIGEKYFIFPIVLGLLITIAGQAIRGATIGLAYIARGGRDKKVYADGLVTTGIFSHCRNPLYVGNIFMLAGVGILVNSLVYTFVVLPVFLFIYSAIVRAEEFYLRNKFGSGFDDYCRNVNRWWPKLNGLGATFTSMEFKWRRWILKEYNTQYIWLTGIAIILLFYYPQLTGYNDNLRNILATVFIMLLFALYMWVKYLKKSKKMVA